MSVPAEAMPSPNKGEPDDIKTFEATETELRPYELSSVELREVNSAGVQVIDVDAAIEEAQIFSLDLYRDREPRKYQAKNESDARLALKAQQGDTAAFDRLCNSYQPLIRLVASNYFLAGGSNEDLIQEGMFGLYKAVRDYESSKSNFYSFAKLCIARQIITAVKTATRLKHAPLNTYVSFSHSVGEDGDDTTLEDALYSPAVPFDEAMIGKEGLVHIVRVLKNELSGLEYDALKLFLEGSSYADIAATLNINTKTVDNALQRVKRKIIRAQTQQEFYAVSNDDITLPTELQLEQPPFAKPETHSYAEYSVSRSALEIMKRHGIKMASFILEANGYRPTALPVRGNKRELSDSQQIEEVHVGTMASPHLHDELETAREEPDLRRFLDESRSRTYALDPPLASRTSEALAMTTPLSLDAQVQELCQKIESTQEKYELQRDDAGVFAAKIIEYPDLWLTEYYSMAMHTQDLLAHVTILEACLQGLSADIPIYNRFHHPIMIFGNVHEVLSSSATVTGTLERPLRILAEFNLGLLKELARLEERAGLPPMVNFEDGSKLWTPEEDEQLLNCELPSEVTAFAQSIGVDRRIANQRKKLIEQRFKSQATE